jgi:hypothetical protein
MEGIMKKIMLFLVAGIILFGSSALFAEETKTEKSDTVMKGKGKMKMTPEQRENMAKSHEQMAACLRSDKTVPECHEEMMNACEKTMGKECKKMMMHNGRHKGMKMEK